MKSLPLNIRQNRLFRIVLLTIVLVIIGFQAMSVTRHAAYRNTTADRMAANYDTHGIVPGNPQNGVQQLQELYRLINVYRSRHGEQFPTDAMSLISDMMPNFRAYNLRSPNLALAAFHNPDVRYSDAFQLMPKSSPDSIIAYNVSNMRFDGTPVGGQKPANRRDVLAWTDIYEHINSVRTKTGGTEKPVGFYLVLWDDGRVEKIPYYMALMVPQGNNEFLYAFPGQAGVPANAVTYDHFWQSLGLKKGPRGPVSPDDVSSSGNS